MKKFTILFLFICYLGTAFGQPIPDILYCFLNGSSSATSCTICLGESVSIDVWSKNIGTIADEGGITFSFPELTSAGDGSCVEAVNPSTPNPGSEGYFEKSAGDYPIYDSNGDPITAIYLMVEWSQINWAGNTDESLEISFQPPSTGTYHVYYRSAMGAPWVNDPTSGTLDQQGWRCNVLTINVGLPDLVPINLTASPTIAMVGGTVGVTCDISNDGTCTSGSSTLKYYLSTNTTWDSSDVLLGSDNVGTIAPGASPGENESLPIPVSTTPGSYYILYFADANYDVVESNEGNNVQSKAIQIIALPDYVIQNPIVSNTTLQASETFDVFHYVANVGYGNASFSSYVKYYLSTNNTWDASDIVLGSNSVSALTSGSTTTYLDLPVQIPGGTSVGTYYILFYADANETITESDETNNVSSVLINVVVSNYLTVSPTTITLPYTVANDDFTITSNTTWNVSESVTWLSVSPVSGSNNDVITVTATENTNTSSRTATVTITGSGVSNQTVVVTQQGTTSTGGILSWDDGVNSNGIGFNGVANFDVAARFLSSDLSTYDGMFLTKIRFVPRESTATYTIKVWQNGHITSSDTTPGNLLISMLLNTGSLIMDNWNEVILSTPVTINSSQELWFGYNVDQTIGYPAGCDDGPAIDFYGNLMYSNGYWNSLLSLASTLDYNWNIQGVVDNVIIIEHGITNNNDFVIIYPNPTSSKLYISAESEISKIEINNMIGQNIISVEDKKEIDLSELPIGMYLVKVYNKENKLVAIEKVIKN